MRKRSLYCVLGATAVVVSVVVVVLIELPVARHSPWAFSFREAVDINSGDVVHWTYVCGLRIREDIQRSAFSQELRRVGVKVPPVRNWKRTSTKVLSGRKIATENLHLSQQCDFVLDVLNLHKASDAERSVLLVEALGILRKGDSEEMNEFLKRLTGKQDWESGLAYPPAPRIKN
jgi:hypothetical protein